MGSQPHHNGMRSTTFHFDKVVHETSFPESWGNPHPPQTAEPREYFIGDIYERYDALSSNNWPENDHDSPYLQKVKYLARSGWPQLRYLADFLDCSTTPIKAKAVTPSDRAERLARCRVAIINLAPDSDVSIHEFTDIDSLVDFLNVPWSDTQGYVRLFLVEDLSSPVVELLGDRFNLDPQFFRAHISDYSWYNVQDPWFEMPVLPSRAAQNAHFTLRYLRPHYFRNPESAERARRRAGGFNVLRRIDFDRNPSWADHPGSAIGSVRSSASIYVRPREEASQGWLGFVLLDPPLKEGYPLWSGYDNIRPPPSYVDAARVGSHLFRSPLEDFVYWTRTMSVNEQQLIRQDNDYILSPVFCSVPAQWLLTFEHLTCRLSLIEWEVERKDHRTAQSLDDALSRLHPWRRSVVNFGYRIRASIDSVEGFRRRNRRRQPDTDDDWEPLLDNFRDLEKRYKVLEAKIDKIMSVLAAVMTIEETKKQMVAARDVARITYLAFIYIPFSFVAAFLSMNEDIFTGNPEVYWIMFVIAIPLTAFSLLLAIYWPWLKKTFKSWTEPTQKTDQDAFSLGRSLKDK